MSRKTRNHGCQCPLNVAQIFSFIGYFLLLIGFWTLIFPSLGLSELKLEIGVSFSVVWLLSFGLILYATLSKHEFNEGDEDDLSSRFCEVCDKSINYDSKHCDICGVCISFQDHHSFLINNCVSKKNRIYFFLGLVCLFLMSLYSMLLCLYVMMGMALDNYLTLRFAREFYNQNIEVYEWYTALAVYATIAFGIILHSSYLTGFHLALLCKGIYTREFWDYYRLTHKVITQDSNQSHKSSQKKSAGKKRVSERSSRKNHTVDDTKDHKNRDNLDRSIKHDKKRVDLRFTDDLPNSPSNHDESSSQKDMTSPSKHDPDNDDRTRHSDKKDSVNQNSHEDKSGHRSNKLSFDDHDRDTDNGRRRQNEEKNTDLDEGKRNHQLNRNYPSNMSDSNEESENKSSYANLEPERDEKVHRLNSKNRANLDIERSDKSRLNESRLIDVDSDDDKESQLGRTHFTSTGADNCRREHQSGTASFSNVDLYEDTKKYQSDDTIFTSEVMDDSKKRSLLNKKLFINNDILGNEKKSLSNDFDSASLNTDMYRKKCPSDNKFFSITVPEGDEFYNLASWGSFSSVHQGHY